MKKILPLLLLSLACRHAGAQETATFDFRIGHEKQLHSILITLDSGAAPGAAANFEKLLRHHFYNGLKVHRVIPHTLVQMGDPLTRYSDRASAGTGGPGYTLPPEIHLRHTVGAVAMARLPDAINPARRSSGSQFYICLKAMPELDGKYTVFGHVTQGMDTLEEISTQEADSNDNPVDAIVIKDARLGSAPAHRFTLWPWSR
jgi:cyclophilin family peptidyl-prolyl cis-trans isomerase